MFLAETPSIWDPIGQKKNGQAGLRDLVPMLRDILERPRKVFQTWRNCALSGEDVAWRTGGTPVPTQF